MFSQELLNILACPVCKGALRAVEDNHGLLCSHCNLEFPVRDGIAVMLPNEAGSPAVRSAA